MEDQIAISRIKQGDPGGLEYLVNTYQVQAVYAAYLIVQDHSLAEEIAQSAFVRVVEKIDQFDEGRPFAPWFFTIVTNAAVKAAKKQARFSGLDEEAGEGGGALAAWLVDPQPLPEKLVEIEESAEVVEAALRQLTPEQRASVVMRYYLEMSEADMVARFKKPLSTVKWWLRSARKRIGALLQETRYFEDHE
jgi:RNA polymerase sigma-70 factor, ECF subfamily